VQVDVFTERAFGGNALAVVLDAGGLADGAMQAIAAEMNLAETTFVVAATRPGCAARVRIFTPTRELPFAGHPTIGTAFVLALEGRLPAGERRVLLDEGIGPVEVTLEGDPARPAFLWMRHREPEFGPEIPERAAAAALLGLAESDLLPGAPVVTGSTGVPFLYVPLRDRQAVDRAAFQPSALAGLPAAARGVGVFLFAPDPDPGRARVYSRMFAPHALGIPEDPATGSGSGPLGAYLVRHRLVKAGDDDVRIVSEQGTRMGRQSFVHIALRVDAGAPRDIRVGGSAVPVLEGVLRVP
jgi:trans-2,3-dihydro-3-hydroxyanthranilate isomerase